MTAPRINLAGIRSIAEGPALDGFVSVRGPQLLALVVAVEAAQAVANCRLASLEHAALRAALAPFEAEGPGE